MEFVHFPRQPMGRPLPFSSKGAYRLGLFAGHVLQGALIAWLPHYLGFSNLNLVLIFQAYWSLSHSPKNRLFQELDGRTPADGSATKIDLEYHGSCIQLTTILVVITFLRPLRPVIWWALAGSIASIGLLGIDFTTIILLNFFETRYSSPFSQFFRKALIGMFVSGLLLVYRILKFLIFIVPEYLMDHIDALQTFTIPWIIRSIGERVQGYSKTPEVVVEFKYFPPLDKETQEIRLLVIPRQSFFFGHLNCSISLHPLGDAPPYEALSYRWEFGDLEKSRLIYVDDKPLKIPDSAYQLLHARSSRWVERVVWIDAICINQKDVAEKNSQVLLMSQIYSKADRVIVWPGDSYLSCRASKMVLRVLNTFDTFDGPHDDFRDFFEDERDQPAWRSMIEDLFTNLYFTRVWVIQEVALGKDIQLYYGGRYISLMQYMTVLTECTHPFLISLLLGPIEQGSVLRSRFQAAVSGANIMTQFRLFEEEWSDDLHIGHVLRETVRSSAFKPVDHVFGLSALLKKNPLPPGFINYERTPREVFLETACIVLCQRVDPLCTLSYAGVGWNDDPLTKSLPSWVVNWAATKSVPPSFFDRAYSVADHSNVGQCTATHLQPQISIVTGNGINPILQLQCIVLDSISHIVEAFDSAAEEKHSLSQSQVNIDRRLWYYNAQKLVQKHCSPVYAVPWLNQRREEAFWRTAIADRTVISRPAPPEFATASETYRALCISAVELEALDLSKVTISESPELLATWPRDSEEEAHLRHFIKCVGDAQENRTFSITTKGCMCLTPLKSQTGDLICIISGAPTPFVMRPYRDHKNEFNFQKPLHQLVGECYVHGIMDGFQMGSNIKFQTFTIV
jgi:hypothetical protein